MLVVHKKSIKKFFRALAAWSKGFTRVVAELRTSWPEIVNCAWQENLNRARLSPWQLSNLEETRSSFAKIAADGPQYSELQYCFGLFSAVGLGNGKANRLEEVAYRFILQSWEFGLAEIRKQLSRLASRTEVFRRVTKEVFEKRCYSRNLKDLPIEQWLLHAGLFGDDLSQELLLDFKQQYTAVLRKRTPRTRQKALVELCQDLPSLIDGFERIGEGPCPVASVLSAN